MSNQMEALRTVVQDETLSTAERTAAAALIVTLTVDGVPEPPDDDAEVVALMQPWADKALAEIAAPVTQGRSLTGFPLPDARAAVLERHKLRAVLRLVVDTALPRQTRLAAVSHVRASLSDKHRFIMNSVSPEQMLDRITGPDTIRLYFNSTTPGWYDKLPVARPPRDLGDVWQ
jgi:hypothetical protein